MAKKRDDYRKGKKTQDIGICNLDGEYKSPVQSLHDLTPGNIQSVLLNSRYAQLLLGLSVIGLLLRVWNLGYNSLWLDEATTYNIASRSFADIWGAMAAGDFNPPLFYWIEHVMLMLGNNEVILRFFPMVFGTLTIPAIYFAGREFMDRNTGIIAAAATTAVPFLIFYSQEARAYSMAVFFMTAAMVYYLRALKNNDIRNWALFGLLAALAFWLHFYVFVLIVALVLYALALQAGNIRKNARKIGLILLSVAIFSIACLPLIIETIRLFFSRTAAAPNFGIQGLDIIYQIFLQISGSNGIVFALFICLFIVGIVQVYLTDKKQALLLVTMLFVTFFVSYILSYRMPMMTRHLLFVTIPFYLGIAASYRFFYRFFSNRGIVYAMVALMILVNVPPLPSYYSGYTKEDWRGFAGKVQNMTDPGDGIVLLPGYMSQPFDYYYQNSSDNTIEYSAYTVKDLEKFTENRKNSTLYYVVTNDIYAVNPKGDEVAWLKNQTKYAGSYTGIYLFISS
jgi:mannosyltransferase